jgi:hypothetical protein
MSGPVVDRWCCPIVELAARMLPAEQRQRYALEFIAELYGMPRSQQLRHSVQVLTHAWSLRTVLIEAGPPTVQIEPVSIARRRPIRCLVRFHHWHWASAEDGGRYQTCLLCGRDKTDSASGLAPRSAIFGG